MMFFTRESTILNFGASGYVLGGMSKNFGV